ncbi:UNVERIFIED_CONTAM: hypothetical protein Sradi_3212700 [Sesamum radiatum]|uniref:Reverse transcriptase n=1 Tax=Sesamum radiatum TaxID=300843 RepID=A0AAW2RFZ2_SESRA
MVREGLIRWDKSNFGHVRSRVKELEEQLVKSNLISAEGRLLHGHLRNELEELLSREEFMWKQRGKAQWLKERDRNTPFFHARASARRRKNSISQLRDRDGEWCNSKEGIQHIISTYFPEFFRSTNPSEKVIAEALGGMTARVSDDMNEALIQPFSPDEVKHLIFQMYPYKFPGPDGLSPVFYQKYWHIVGPEVTSFVIDFLSLGKFDANFNYTFIMFIPKCPSHECMTHFRPISLCNITYKIASKCLLTG